MHITLGQGNCQVRFPSTFFKNLMRQFFIIHFSLFSFKPLICTLDLPNGTKRVDFRPLPAQKKNFLMDTEFKFDLEYTNA